MSGLACGCEQCALGDESTCVMINVVASETELADCSDLTSMIQKPLSH